jgi:copper(I)-binding protein
MLSNVSRALRWAPVFACSLLVALMTLLPASAAIGHGASAGDIEVEHPYALPTPPGAKTGAVYFRALRNAGRQPDRLIGASTPAAARVEIHESVIDNAGVMRMRELESIDLPARKEVRPRHQGHLHLMLIDLKAPLENGGRFPIRLKFERSGEVEVMVWVQQPKRGAAAEHRH